MTNINRIDSRMGDPVEKILFQDAKQGGTGTTTVRGGADSWLTTVAQSQTGADAVYHLSGLKQGDQIVGYHLIGQVESAGNTATVDAKLVSMTAAAADVATADVTGSAMTQVSATADTKLSATNTTKAFNEENYVTIADGVTYAVVVTITTAASTDVALQGVVLHVRPAR